MTKRCTTEELARWILDRDDFVVLGHENPDGDATGSTLGLWHTLRALGKRAVVCLPGGVTYLFRHLPGAEAIVPTGEPLPFEPKTALSVDASEVERLGEAGRALFERCGERGVIDHHATNPGFGQVMLLDGQAAAAGEMVVEVIEAMGAELSREAAECLFVAISTDCGHFSYSSTRQRTFRAAGLCVAAGIDIDGVTRQLYRTRSQARTKLLGLVLSGLEVSGDGKIAWARLTKGMLDAAHAGPEDNEGIVNYLQEIGGAKCAILAQERGGGTKLSLRSTPPFDVARAIALPLSGGGHACAAGANVPLPLEEALQKALGLAREALERS